MMKSVTVQEAAEILGVTPDAVYKAIGRGKLDARREKFRTEREVVTVYIADLKAYGRCKNEN